MNCSELYFKVYLEKKKRDRKKIVSPLEAHSEKGVFQSIDKVKVHKLDNF